MILQVVALVTACVALGFAVHALFIVRSTQRRLRENAARSLAREARRYRPGGPVGKGDGSLR